MTTKLYRERSVSDYWQVSKVTLTKNGRRYGSACAYPIHVSGFNPSTQEWFEWDIPHLWYRYDLTNADLSEIPTFRW